MRSGACSANPATTGCSNCRKAGNMGLIGVSEFRVLIEAARVHPVDMWLPVMPSIRGIKAWGTRHLLTSLFATIDR